MRRVLILVAVILALVVAARYFHWRWAEPATYLRHGARLESQSAARSVTGTGGTCGKVADVRFVKNSNGRPTFIDFGKPHPHEDFSVVIWGVDRAKFHPPPETWRGKTICVTGVVKNYHGRTEIIAYRPGQIRLTPN